MKPMSSNVEVLIDNTWVQATVIDCLSVQFTAELEDERRVVYKLYADKSTEWREV